LTIAALAFGLYPVLAVEIENRFMAALKMALRGIADARHSTL